MEIDADKVTFRIKIMEDPKIKAIVTVDFGDITIKGYRIMVSTFLGEHGEYLWVVPPSYQSKGGWKPIAHITDKNKWKAIEVNIVKQYLVENEAYIEKKMSGKTQPPRDEVKSPGGIDF